MSDLSLRLPDEVIEAIAERVAEILRERQDGNNRSPYLSGASAAAEYLGWPTERVYKHLVSLPHFRHGRRLMFRRDELDAWVEARREVA